jgi:hypothetical protein
VLDYWLWRRERRLRWAATFWPATLFALPGVVAAIYVHPTTLNTVDGFALFLHGAAVGAGLGAGLAFALHGVVREAPAEWSGVVLGLLLLGGAAAIHLNAEQPDTEPAFVSSRVLDTSPRRGRLWRAEQSVRQRGLRSVEVEWQGRPLRIVVDPDLGLREGSAVLLSVSGGRFGFPVIDEVRPVEARVR